MKKSNENAVSSEYEKALYSAELPYISACSGSDVNDKE